MKYNQSGKNKLYYPAIIFVGVLYFCKLLHAQLQAQNPTFVPVDHIDYPITTLYYPPFWCEVVALFRMEVLYTNRHHYFHLVLLLVSIIP